MRGCPLRGEGGAGRRPRDPRHAGERSPAFPCVDVGIQPLREGSSELQMPRSAPFHPDSPVRRRLRVIERCTTRARRTSGGSDSSSEAALLGQGLQPARHQVVPHRAGQGDVVPSDALQTKASSKMEG